ncbi:MAG: beta-L-arabinofuranosidase domain-containing protein [Hyphomonadaceae bacterium]
MFQPSRRSVLMGGAAAIALTGCAHGGVGEMSAELGAAPFPLTRVRLKPSLFADAVEVNRRYLHRLEPDRLLHNFRKFAGLEPRSEIYGGWESDTIAGHTLGHYLSACALMHAQTGDDECARRARYIVSELAACQAAGGDGYVAGFTRTNAAGETESGRRVFEEIATGDIRPQKFYINGSWAPLYTWHKLFAGLYDAQSHCGVDEALPIALGVAGYLESKTSGLSDEQMQRVLECEHGGIRESLVELYARTGDARWLRLAERFHHAAVLDPLAESRDDLSHLHANTQIPKIIGLARSHELTQNEAHARAASFFWETVTATRSYVIGGNSDREHFQEPNSLSRYVTEQTCESCNTYNMLKLTRHLYARSPQARYFDYYERAHLNHIMAHQRASDGAFAYMVPLMSGAHREWSTPEGEFWCCVGTGMESHAKHGESIYWRNADTLFVNLYIASELDWAERGARVAMESRLPHSGDVDLRIEALERPQSFTIALRAPTWANRAISDLIVNDERVSIAAGADGYLRITRRWQAGDRVSVSWPATLRLEATPDDPDTVAVLHGPLVLAASLGPASEPWSDVAPALVGEDVLAGFRLASRSAPIYECLGVARPRDLRFRPFYEQHDQRTAVYFKRYTPQQWEAAQAAFAAEADRQRDLDARSVDVIRLGDEADERAHNLAAEISYPLSYRFRPGRDCRSGGFIEFDANVGRARPVKLKATYWGGERDKWFYISIDGQRIAEQRINGDWPHQFVDIDYDIPEALLRGKRSVRVRFEPAPEYRIAPCFGVRLFRP